MHPGGSLSRLTLHEVQRLCNFASEIAPLPCWRECFSSLQVGATSSAGVVWASLNCTGCADGTNNYGYVEVKGGLLQADELGLAGSSFTVCSWIRRAPSRLPLSETWVSHTGALADTSGRSTGCNRHDSPC